MVEGEGVDSRECRMAKPSCKRRRKMGAKVEATGDIEVSTAAKGVGVGGGVVGMGWVGSESGIEGPVGPSTLI